MPEIPFDSALSALRLKVKTAFGLDTGRPIGDSMSEAVPVTVPMGYIEIPEGIPIYDAPQQDTSFMEIVTAFDVKCWYFTSSVQNTKSAAAVTAKLRALVGALASDPHVGGTVTRVLFKGIYQTGNPGEWPVSIQQGSGVSAGYLMLNLRLIEVR